MEGADPITMFSLGQRIRSIRIKKGLTQADLAQGLCTPSMISQIETDRARPSYTMLAMLSERLETPLDNLLAEVDLYIDAISTYKIAQALMASGSHFVAIPLLQELIAQKTSISTVKLQLSLIDCYIETTQYQQAKSLLSEVAEIAHLHTDPF